MPDSDHSLLVHIGPGEKHAYPWDPCSGAAGETLESPRRLIMRPGDVLYIPAGQPHVFDTRVFSVMLGLSVFPTTRRVRLHEALDLAWGGDDEPAFFDGEHATGEDAPPMAAALREAMRRAALLLASNGYVATPPRPAAPTPGRTRMPAFAYRWIFRC